MTTINTDIIDLGITPSHLLSEVLVGLSKCQKSISSKFLYDKRGSEIFEEIVKLPEYYPSRTEFLILEKHAQEIAAFIGEEALLIEPGAGSCQKIKLLLPHLRHSYGYVPIEISKTALLNLSEDLLKCFPDLKILPICADFSQNLTIPFRPDIRPSKKVIFFPGSTIGNFHPSEAISLMKDFGKAVGKKGGLLIGVDLKKDPELIIPAYDDAQGITSKFNLNLLTRLNREINADFDIRRFYHHVQYDSKSGRIEMYLKSKINQLVRVHQTVFRFKEGETIHTEFSYKYSTDEFCELAAKARFKIRQMWKDEKKLFCVYYFVRD